MALPTSGTLSMSDIAGEFGGATPHSLSEYYGAATGVPTAGTISVSDFYGTSAVATVNGKIVASKFENFNNVFYPTPGDAGDNNDSTGLQKYTGTYPNFEKWSNFYCDSGVAGGYWPGVPPAAAFRDKTILAVRKLRLTARTYGAFTIDLFGDSRVGRYQFSIVGRTGSTLTEYTQTPVVNNGLLGQSSPRYQTRNFDFYPTKSSGVTNQISLAQAKEIISGGLIARFNGVDDGDSSHPSLLQFEWDVDFDYVP